jgi:hypothetical protein
MALRGLAEGGVALHHGGQVQPQHFVEGLLLGVLGEADGAGVGQALGLGGALGEVSVGRLGNALHNAGAHGGMGFEQHFQFA